MQELKKPEKYWFEDVKLNKMTESELLYLEGYLKDLVERADIMLYKVMETM